MTILENKYLQQQHNMNEKKNQQPTYQIIHNKHSVLLFEQENQASQHNTTKWRNYRLKIVSHSQHTQSHKQTQKNIPTCDI